MKKTCESYSLENQQLEQNRRDAFSYLGVQRQFTRPDAFDGHCTMIKIVSLFVLLVIGGLDYVTGYEFGFFIFYFIPVALSSWYCGRRLGVQIAFGSALVWYLSDRFTFHPYSESYFIYWEVFMRLLSFLTTTLTISRIRIMVLNEERLLSELLITKQELETFRSSGGSECCSPSTDNSK